MIHAFEGTGRYFPRTYSVFTFDEQLRYYPKSLKELRKGNPFNKKLHEITIGFENDYNDTLRICKMATLRSDIRQKKKIVGDIFLEKLDELIPE